MIDLRASIGRRQDRLPARKATMTAPRVARDSPLTRLHHEQQNYSSRELTRDLPGCRGKQSPHGDRTHTIAPFTPAQSHDPLQNPISGTRRCRDPTAGIPPSLFGSGPWERMLATCAAPMTTSASEATKEVLASATILALGDNASRFSPRRPTTVVTLVTALRCRM